VTISNFVDGDILSFTNTPNITGTYNASTGVLTLTGQDTIANYRAALRSVKFNSIADDPTANNTKLNRIINWQVTDANANGVGAATSNITQSRIQITTFDQEPVTPPPSTPSTPFTIPSTINQNTIDSHVQVFFNGFSIKNDAYNEIFSGETAGAKSTVDGEKTTNIFNHYFKEQGNGKADQLRAEYWSWAHMPDFVNLTPIVQGLTETLNVLEKTENSTHQSDTTGGLDIKNNSEGEGLPIKQTDNHPGQVAEGLPIKQTENPSDQLNTAFSKLEEHDAYIKRMNFQQKVTALLQDFGFEVKRKG
jgi:hypothetical protein